MRTINEVVEKNQEWTDRDLATVCIELFSFETKLVADRRNLELL
jgi:hypothetical protein